MRHTILAPFAFTALLVACDWNTPADYKPKADYEAFLKKQEDAKAAAAAGGGAAEVPGKAAYETYCGACHGIDGKADGAGALAMNPKPRNFHDKEWQAKVDDAHIHKVIKEGGAAVGLSATMAPWGAAINDAEIDNIVKYIRQFGK
jgi:mono/diheme cytochrome c family protein